MIRTRRTTFTAVAIAVLLTGSLAGCAAPQPPDSAPSIRGAITRVTPNAEGLGVILIEETTPQGFEFDKASLTITEDTAILARNQSGHGYREVTFGALMEGVFVEAWVTGPVAESYPIQAAADAVLILP